MTTASLVLGPYLPNASIQPGTDEDKKGEGVKGDNMRILEKGEGGKE